MKKYTPLLKETAHAEDQMVDATCDHEATRASFVMQISSAQPRRTVVTRKIAMAAAAAIIMTVAAGLFWSLKEQSQPSDPQWIQVGKTESRLVQFDDGTKVRFFENSSGRVAQTAPGVGEVTLESGSVNLRVPHTRTTSWHVLAGPYKVAVTGTQFKVQWDPEQNQVKVTVFKGSVRVTGPMLENGQAVIANRSLIATPTRSSVQVYPATDAIEDDTEIHQTANGTGDFDAEKSATTKQKEKTSQSFKKSSSKKTLNWQKFAKAGEYEKVSNHIKTHGLKQMLRGATPTTYLVLGNAARQARDFQTAQTVYIQLRKQHPSSGAAPTAALYIGRMAFDQQHQYSKAVRWFNVYLGEQKSGTLHRETLGRLMEAQIKSGMNANAKQTANHYLTQYPSGPHAGRAKELAKQ